MEDHEYEHSETEKNFEHEFTDNITCPYCSYEYGYEESREMPGNTTNAWRFYVECRQCEKMFSASWNFMIDDDGEYTDSMEFFSYHEKQTGR